MDKILTTDVFTPTTPARLTFVERAAINAQVVDALRTPGKQLVIYGSSGSGKTTLLVNKLCQLYDSHITTRCMDGISIDHMILDAFDQLAPYYSAERTNNKSDERKYAFSAEYIGLRASIEQDRKAMDSQLEKRLLPPQLTPARLASFLGAQKCCWVLDDFHKVADADKKRLSQIMKVFMDSADAFREVKIVAIGAVDTARQVVQYDPEMRNRVAEIGVPLMSDAEIREILDLGEKHLNVGFGEQLKQQVAHYSSGLASVCHQLALNICQAADIDSTRAERFIVSEEITHRAYQRYIADSADSLKDKFDKAQRQFKAAKFDNGKLILTALASCPWEGGTHNEIMKRIKKSQPSYPSGNLSMYLDELQTPKRGEILRKDGASGRFSFSDPLYFTYAKMLFLKPTAKIPETQEFLDAFLKAFTEEMKKLQIRRTT